MGKPIEVVTDLLEEIASNNYHWTSERVAPKRGGGKHKVDAVTLLASGVDAVAQQLDKVATPSVTSAGHQWGPMYTVRPMVYRDIPPLSVTMLPLALNTSTLSIITTHHRKIAPNPPPIARVGRVIRTLSTKIPTLAPRVLPSYLLSTTDLPNIHPLHLLNLHLTWRVLWSASWQSKARSTRLLVSQSTY